MLVNKFYAQKEFQSQKSLETQNGANNLLVYDPYQSQTRVLNSLILCHALFSFSVGAKTQPESKCPELLANYCDMLLRKTPLSKKLTSEEVEKKLRDVVSSWQQASLSFNMF